MPIKYLILHGSRSYDECSVYGHDDNLSALLKKQYKTTTAFFGQNEHRLGLKGIVSLLLFYFM